MDTDAANYNPTATHPLDSACLYEGCVVPTAVNYDSIAYYHDRSCRYTVLGCTQPGKINYHSAATEDDGSCVTRVEGCAHPSAVNFDSRATAATPTCRYKGCIDRSADNFLPIATVSDPDSCVYLVRGCMAPSATNYNPTADRDDGTCEYPTPGCADPTAANYYSEASAGQTASCKYVGCMDPTSPRYDSKASVPSVCAEVLGCTNPAAVNYAENANVDDGSCAVLGCTDSHALNYDAAASTDDFSCVQPLYGCLNSASASYTPTADLHDPAMCQWLGCMHPQAVNYDPSATLTPSSSLKPELACRFQRAAATVASFGYLEDCLAFVDEDADFAPDAGAEPNATSDSTGFYTMLYQQDGLVQVMPSAFSTQHGACVDTLTKARLTVPLLTLASATMATPLTTIGALLVRDFSNAEGLANYKILTKMGVSTNSNFPSGDVFNFDALQAVLFSAPPMQKQHIGWLVRQLQVQTSVTCLAKMVPGVDPMTAATQAYNSIAALVHNMIEIDLTDPTQFAELLIMTANSLGEVVVEPGQAIAACTETNRRLLSAEAIADAASAVGAPVAELERVRARQLSEEAPVDYSAVCDLADTQADVTDPDGEPLFPNSASPCADGQLVGASAGCTVDTALNFDSSALLPHTATCRIEGCNDSSASNFDPRATVSDGTCEGSPSATAGCTDPSATNYNAAAEVYDGSCAWGLRGCTEPTAPNYNAAATADDGSCVFPKPGCLVAIALNYDSLATANANCRFTPPDTGAFELGCTDPAGLNFDSTADAFGGCTYPVAGCTDSRADNFVLTAAVPVAGDATGGCALLGCTNASSPSYASWAVDDDGSCENGALGGCTAAAALNYMPGAEIDDGSCAVLGCTDSAAPNHNAAATVNDGSCISVVRGCTDKDADNYSPVAAVLVPERCIYVGCTEPAAANYDSRADYPSNRCVDAPPGSPPPPRATSDGTVDKSTLLSSLPEGGFNFTLAAFELFGYAVAGIGDVDGDGVPDLAVGAPGHGGYMRGAAYVLFLDPLTGQAKGSSRLHEGLDLSAYDHFGAAVAGVGDVDGDGVPDLAVGAWGDDGARSNMGSVYIIFLARGGGAKLAPGGGPAFVKLGAEQLSAASGVELNEGAEFGASLALLSNDGVGGVELAVGAPGVHAGFPGGTAHILTLTAGGELASSRQLAPQGLGLAEGVRFGASLAAVEGAGPLGGAALAVGASGPSEGDDLGDFKSDSDVEGLVYLLDVTQAYEGALIATVASPRPLRGAQFGRSVVGTPDYDGNGVSDLVVGAPAEAEGGALYVLFLTEEGGVATHRRIAPGDLGLGTDAALGRAAARLGRVDADLVEDLAIGVNYDAPVADGALDNAGAALVLFMNAYSYPLPPPSPPPSPTLPPPPVGLPSWAETLLQRQNEHRVDHCGPELAWDAALAEQAMAYAQGCPAADERSAAAQRGEVGESVAVGDLLFGSAAQVVTAWYAEEATYRHYGDEPPPSGALLWGRFAQMVWVNSTRLGCGYSSNCSAGATWVCQYAPPGLTVDFVNNVRPNTGPGCVLSPSPPTPPPPKAKFPPPPPEAPPFQEISDTDASISDPDSKGTVRFESWMVSLVVLSGLVAFGCCYYVVCRNHSLSELVDMNVNLVKTVANEIVRLPETIRHGWCQPSFMLGLAPAMRLEFNWSRPGRTPLTEPPYEMNFDSIVPPSPLMPGSVLPPAWTDRSEEGAPAPAGGGGGAARPARTQVTYATNYSTDTTWQ